jgi:type II restriction enzyme
MSHKAYIDPKKSKTFAAKNKKIQELINHSLLILEAFGVPIDSSNRRLERMAMSFLAVADISSLDGFTKTKDINHKDHLPKTRDIIKFINEHFGESISDSSYDDIRRKDLRLLLAAKIVLNSDPTSATNDSRRGYGINPFYAELIRSYGQKGWTSKVASALEHEVSIANKLKRNRNIQLIPVELPTGKKLMFSPGAHNELQKLIIEAFLPRYGFGAKVLYVGDTSDKYLHLDKKGLEDLAFFELSHDELPDIIAYSSSKNWLYLIEAVHTSGPIDELRLLKLKELTEACQAEMIFVTAFLDKPTFRKYAPEIAWETEVWIADNPDHLIHFNGDKFLGPYTTE